MSYREAFRPQFHFIPDAKWLNDPNGLVTYDGEYHSLISLDIYRLRPAVFSEATA